jgi:hypothetical protein
MAKSTGEKKIEKQAKAVSAGIGLVPLKKRREIAAANGYSVENSLVEVDEMIAFAKLTAPNQISALLRLKAQLCGFLSEQLEIYAGSPDILGAMAEAALRSPLCNPVTAIDADYSVVPPVDDEGVFS